MYLLTHLLTYLLTDSLIHSLTYSPSHSVGTDSSTAPLYSDTINILCKSSNVLYHTTANIRAYLHGLTTRTWFEDVYLKCYTHCFTALNDCSNLTTTLTKETVTSLVELVTSLDDNHKPSGTHSLT
jgi:hypothetical protein